MIVILIPLLFTGTFSVLIMIHQTMCPCWVWNMFLSSLSKLLYVFTVEVGWLIILLTGLCWDIIGYESEPLPSHHELRNCSYSIKLNYTTYLSTPPVHLWGGRPSFPLFLPAASWCTPQWGGSPRLPLPPLTRGTRTICLPRASPSSWWSVAPLGGGTPPGPCASPLSPPSSCYRTRPLTAPPPYTSLSGPVPLLPYFPAILLYSSPPPIFPHVLVDHRPISIIVSDRLS